MPKKIRKQPNPNAFIHGNAFNSYPGKSTLLPPSLSFNTTNPIQRTPEEEKERNQDVAGNINNAIDFANNLLEIVSDEDSAARFNGIGHGFGAFSEILKRSADGEDPLRAAGGGLTKLLSGFGGDRVVDALNLQGGGGLSTAGGFAGSALKFIGGLMGEEAGPDIGVTDMGEYLDVASKLNPSGLVKQGISEGFMGVFNVLSASADSIAEGSSDPLIELGEQNLKGATGPITQGWQMIANMASSAASGNFTQEMFRIGDMASSGELGSLPKLGSKIGDTAYNVQEVASAGWGMMTDLVSGDFDSIDQRRDQLAMSRNSNPLAAFVADANDFGDSVAEDWVDITHGNSGVNASDLLDADVMGGAVSLMWDDFTDLF